MAMAEDHAAKLAEPSEAPRLGALFAAGRLDGNHQDKLLALQVTPSTLTMTDDATRADPMPCANRPAPVVLHDGERCMTDYDRMPVRRK